MPSFPKNPETVVIKNNYYPSGITELDVWNYYQNVKKDLLQQIKFRDLIFYIMTDVNKYIIKRRGKTTNFIRLTSKNYDELITGRTVSIHSTMKTHEDIGVIDIDTDNFTLAKQAAIDIYQEVVNSFPLPVKVSIRFTGKTSFHIFLQFSSKIRIDSIRMIIRNFLLSNDRIKRNYTVAAKRTSRVPNLDIQRNSYRAGFISLHSLSVVGLKCVEISFRDIRGFSPRLAVVNFKRLRRK